MTREEAIQWLTDIKENITENWSHDVAIDMAIEALSARPTGEWINVKMDYGKCSECGFFGITTDYCPNCGARMK